MNSLHLLMGLQTCKRTPGQIDHLKNLTSNQQGQSWEHGHYIIGAHKEISILYNNKLALKIQKNFTNTLLVSVSVIVRLHFLHQWNCGDIRMSTETLILSVVQDVSPHGSYITSKCKLLHFQHQWKLRRYLQYFSAFYQSLCAGVIGSWKEWIPECVVGSAFPAYSVNCAKIPLN